MDEHHHDTVSLPGLALILAGLLGLLAVVIMLAQPASAAQLPSCSAQAAPSAASGASGSFTVTGTVRDRSNALVANVQVFAFSAEFQNFTYTNSSAQFSLTLPAGTY